MEGGPGLKAARGRRRLTLPAAARAIKPAVQAKAGQIDAGPMAVPCSTALPQSLRRESGGVFGVAGQRPALTVASLRGPARSKTGREGLDPEGGIPKDQAPNAMATAATGFRGRARVDTRAMRSTRPPGRSTVCSGCDGVVPDRLRKGLRRPAQGGDSQLWPVLALSPSSPFGLPRARTAPPHARCQTVWPMRPRLRTRADRPNPAPPVRAGSPRWCRPR